MFWRWYRGILSKHPWKTQLLTAGILGGSGDLIAQFAVERKPVKNYEPGRTVRFFGLGSCYIAPIVQTWLIFLEKTVRSTPRFLPIKKMLIDQSMFSPCFNSSVLIVLRLIEGKGWDGAVELWKRDFVQIYITSLKIWPIVQLFNFYLVPLNYRIIVIQVVALFWNTYIAYTTQKVTHQPQMQLNS